MRYPPRFSHLVTRAVLVAKLVPGFAEAHRLDDEEAATRASAALQGPVLEELLGAVWTALLGSTQRLDEEALLAKVATTLRDRPLRPGRPAEVTPGWSAFFLTLDIAAGTASDAVRRVMETDEGRKKATRGMEEVASYLAKELSRGR